ncbi:winged helix-turn-helix domain-containing protein [Clostridium butyricum]|uniref:Uncharacterized protein n=1 Tax=Clostridium butyricum TaxID=1492 RepID=A0A6N2Z1Z0_CLOBU|nr:winged helix-turn-helix domain-containing protein [Clostridium butyricum]EMU53264.1 hypothetical protein CBDKU1_27840 [Clostridium butyricum DKU-01]MDU5102543.1 winged helix-turn-helix domain-containing protein [Clostridium butyricum]MZI82999.1 hypothetical protein [Clostridium butyricum]
MLQSGMKFNNYKILCEHMSWKIYKSGSNSYKAQMKQLDSLCKWHKEKRIFIIDEVYTKPLVKKDNRRKKSIYIDLLREVFLFNLRKNKINNFVSTKTIIKTIGVFKEEFYNICNREEYAEKASDVGVSSHDLRGFKVGASREVQRIVERALDSLKRQNIISYEQGRIVVTDEGICRFADHEELQIIKMIEREQLKSMKCKNMGSVKLKGLDEKFRKGLKKRFSHMGLEYINYTFYGYKILSYDNEEARLININEVEASVNELKNLFKIRLNKFAKSNYEREVRKAYQSMAFGEPILEFNPKTSNNYLSNFEKLIEWSIE